jgi:type II secretory pathway pseudopilin PulG
VGLALVTVLSVAAVVLAIASVGGANDLERVESALRQQANCADIVVRRVSRATVATQWAGSAAQAADIGCTGAGPRVVYVKFIGRTGLARALTTDPPAEPYCLVGDAILVDRRVGAASTVLSDMCQSVGGSVRGLRG